MNAQISGISKVLLIVGFGIIGLYFVEIIGEFSPLIEGVYFTLGIQWRYPIILAGIAFLLAYFLDKKAKKPVLIGIAGLLGLVILFSIFFLIVLLFMMTGGSPN